MLKHVRKRFSFLSMLFLLVVLFSACNEQSSPSSNSTNTQGNTPAATATMVTTPQVLPTQTDCPAQGTARAAVMPPLPKGQHQGFVYDFMTDTSIIFRKYDTVTKSKTDLLTLPYSPNIPSIPWWKMVSISADGQWMVFVTQKNKSLAIQMIRLDGQELQTLYCTGIIHTISLSPDQKYLAFGEIDTNEQALYTIEMSSGTIHKTLTMPNDHAMLPVYEPIKWASNTSLYVIKTPTSGVGGMSPWGLRYRLGLFLVKDITQDSNTQASNLQTISLNGAAPNDMQDFDLLGNEKVFFNTFVGSNAGLSPDGKVFQGPSEIDAQPITGGPVQTIYKSQTQGILYTRLASDQTLLFIAESEAFDLQTLGPAATQPPSTEDNGLWAVNMDGSGLHRLVELPPGDRMEFNLRVYTPWSTVSRDGTLYAVAKLDSKKNEVDLLYGSMDGKTQTNIGSISVGKTDVVFPGYINVIGWTVL